MTGEYFKLYCDTHDQYHELLAFLKKIQYQFYSIKLKAERPIKVVIKGLPKKAKPEDIEKDLIDLGFTVDRVSQLIGKITNQPLPVFLVSLPRNMTNANIFKLDKLSFLNVTVEGYDSKGVTQCYKCQQFNHTASNCHIKPKCLKCGEPHQTSECEIDRVETMYCVNCEAYGHMANYSKCPLYPKPRKGATIKPNYTTIVNSLVRPNVSFAQAAAQQEKNKNTAPTPQQMAPRIGQVPTTITAQTQAATTHIAKQQKPIILEQLPPVGLLSEKISKNEIKLFDYAKINSESTLEEKVAKFADAVSSAHNLASKPIKNTRHSYTPQHINYLITCKNRARKLYQQTLNPLHKTEANRLQKLIKKEIRIHAQNTWNAKLESLETQDNSLWRMQKYFRKKRSDIPNLTGPNGIASNDEQKANLIANTFIDNYTENKRPGKHTTNIDSDVTNTLTRFFSTPPSSPISPTDPDEICDYMKKLKTPKHLESIISPIK
ncbi:nucleic-acid-binding protein from transposon X-element [Trichonephila clavipes]|nr:nucleic-acid-binding protein from transposon X-element [Trichonephila clavipes]